MNPRTLRTGIATRLKTIKGLTVYERWPGQLNPPCAVVDVLEAEPEQVMGRGDLTRWTVNVHLFMSLAAGPENAQDRLDPLLATSSTGGVFGAIAADRTLGGIAHATFIKGHSDYMPYVIDENISYEGVRTELEVWAS